MSHYGYKSSRFNVFVGMGERIDLPQSERNISGVDVERATGIDKKTFYAIKERGDCRLSNIIKIANYFNVSLDWLVYGKERTNV